MSVAFLDRVESEFKRWDGYVEQPMGSNHTVFNRWLYGSNVAAAWCHSFVSFCFWAAGYTDFPRTAYTPAGAAACVAKWGKLRSNQRLQRGDVIYYYWRSMGRIAHIGWFSHYEGDYLRVWEGNTDYGGSRTGGKVVLQRRSRATINESLGGVIVRVPYLPPTPIPVPSPEEDDMKFPYLVRTPPGAVLLVHPDAMFWVASVDTYNGFRKAFGGYGPDTDPIPIDDVTFVNMKSALNFDGDPAHPPA